MANRPGNARSQPKRPQVRPRNPIAFHFKALSVPVDGQIVLADDFVVTPEKKASIDKANEAVKKGDQKQAIEDGVGFESVAPTELPKKAGS